MPEENLEQTAVQAEPQEPQQEPKPEELQKDQQEEKRQEAERREAEAAALAAEKARNSRAAAVLSALLLFCLVLETVLASYVGLTIYRNSQENKILTAQYEAYLERQAQAKENPPKVQYIGPTLRVVDGVLMENTSRPQIPQGA